MTSKRGHEKAVVASVLAVAIVGMFFSFGTSLAPSMNETTYATPSVRTTYVNIPFVSGQFAMPSGITGEFAVSAAKEYGGEIKGLTDSSRSFSGRATNLDDTNCYQCSCLKNGITSPNRKTAAMVCGDNCGGSIVKASTGRC